MPCCAEAQHSLWGGGSEGKILGVLLQLESEKKMTAEEKEKLKSIKEVNQNIFQIVENCLKNKDYFEYENKLTNEIEVFKFNKELSQVEKDKTRSKNKYKHKFYTFEKTLKNSPNSLSKNFLQANQNGYTPHKQGVQRLGVKVSMGVGNNLIDTDTKIFGAGVNTLNFCCNSLDLFNDRLVDFNLSKVNDFHKFYISRLYSKLKNQDDFYTLFSKARPLAISFDTEYTHVNDDRYVITAMYSFKILTSEFVIFQVLADSQQQKYQDFKDFIKLLMRILKISFNLKNFPLRISKNVVENGEIIGENVKAKGKRLYISLITHFGRTDLSFFKMLNNTTYKRKQDLNLNDEDYNRSLLSICKTAGQGGVFSMQSHGNFNIYIDRSNGYNRYARFNITIRDTMNFTNSNNLSLQAIGKSLGFEKMDMSKNEYENMHVTFKNSTYKFIKYSLADAIITQRYYNQILGENVMLSPTLNGINAQCFVDKQMQVLSTVYNFNESGRLFNKTYDQIFRCLEKIENGLKYDKKEDKLKLDENYRIINNDPYWIEFFTQCRESYFGGNNQSFGGYWIDKKTIDIDLKSAYPTTEACIYDIDYEKAGAKYVTRRDIEYFTDLLQDDPFLPCIVCIRSFKFNDNIKFPCITQKVSGNIVYTQEKNDSEFLYLTGVEYWAALQQKAEIDVESIIVPAMLKDDNRVIVKTLGHVNSYLVKQRKKMKEKHGKGSKEELDYKLAANASYGKMAQQLSNTHSYNALSDSYEDVGMSCITNSYYAAYITATARAILNLTAQEIHDLGYSVYSCTTDGLITDLSESDLSKLQVYGLKRFIQENRCYFFDEMLDSDIFEVKHRQDCFLNVATRHNVATEHGGVLAHGGIKTQFIKDSEEDRDEMIRAFLECSYQGYDYVDSDSVSFRDIVMKDKKFYKKDKIKTHSMKYDFKRKPCEITDKTITFKDKQYIVADFDTVAYKNIEEFKKYRDASKNAKLIRTKADFDRLFLKSNNKRIENKVYVKQDSKSSKVVSLLRYYFQDMIDIECFRDKKQREIANILNKINYSEREITVNDIKNAKRKSRTSVLRIEDLQDLIEILKNVQ